MTEVVLIQVSFLTVGSKQQKNNHTNYQGVFISLKNQVNSK